jgi:dTMP kinase
MKFITFEGGEGSGKSTQVALLADAFTKARIPHLTTREPGGTVGAEEIRRLLVEGEPGRWEAMSETLLFQAARVEHVQRVIRPALKEGKWVLCDRFVDSTIVYQGIAKDLTPEFVQQLHALTLPGFLPDLTFLLDVDPDRGLSRTHGRLHEENRFERMGHDFHASLREGFLALARSEPARFVTVDAGGDVALVHARLVSVLKDRYNLPL